MKKLNVFFILALLLFSGCQKKVDLDIEIGDNFYVETINVNEVGIFGTGHIGMLYYDFSAKDNIAILENTQDKIYQFGSINGLCYYNNKIYYFDNFENAKLYVMDVDGKNQTELVDLTDSAYNEGKTLSQFIYNDNKIIFNVSYTKWHPDSQQNENYEQLWMYDIEKDVLTAINDKAKTRSKDHCQLAAYIDDQVIYFKTTMDEDILEMEEFEIEYGSSKDYPFYLNEHTERTFYTYDVNTKASKELLKGRGIDVEPRNATYASNLVFRQKNEIKKIDIQTKAIETLTKDDNLYTIYTTLDNKIFYTTLVGDIDSIKYYDIETKETVISESYKLSDNSGFYPVYETSEYFVGLKHPLVWCYLPKEDFYKKDFSRLTPTNW